MKKGMIRRNQQKYLIGIKEKLEFENLISSKYKNWAHHKENKEEIEYLLINGKIAKGYLVQAVDYIRDDNDDKKEIGQDQLWMLDNGELVHLIYYYHLDYKNNHRLEQSLDFPDKEEFNINMFDFNRAIDELVFKFNV